MPEMSKGNKMFTATLLGRDGNVTHHTSAFRDEDHARAFHNGRHEVVQVLAVAEGKNPAPEPKEEAEPKPKPAPKKE